MLVGFHGYAETADAQFERLQAIPGTEAWTLVSIQGLHTFYRGRSEEVVASWMTRVDRELIIEDNIAYVDAVIAEIGIGAEPLVFAGFSQGTAMAWRAALLGAHAGRGIIANGGDVPPELQALDAGRWAGKSALIGRGIDDPWYTDAKLAADLAFLEGRPVAVESLRVEGGHEWPAAFGEAAGRWLETLIAGLES